jgi:hypothetical protein
MAASPQFKIFTRQNEYIASFKHVEDAIQFIAVRAAGTTIRFGHKRKDTLWEVGIDDADGVDIAAEIVHHRLAEMHRAGYRAAYGTDPPAEQLP